MEYRHDPYLLNRYGMPPWTAKEIELLVARQPVPTRTQTASRCKGYAYGIRHHTKTFANSLYAPPVHPVGSLPCPKWWKRAQSMRAAGIRVTDISRLLGHSVPAVGSAVYPEARERRCRERKRGNDKRRSDPAYRVKERETYSAHRDLQRLKAREIARKEWRAAGADPDALERYYRRYECL